MIACRLSRVLVTAGSPHLQRRKKTIPKLTSCEMKARALMPTPHSRSARRNVCILSVCLLSSEVIPHCIQPERGTESLPTLDGLTHSHSFTVGARSHPDSSPCSYPTMHSLETTAYQ